MSIPDAATAPSTAETNSNATAANRTLLAIVLSALGGLAVGGALVSGILLFVLNEQRKRYQAEVETLQAEVERLTLPQTAADGLARLATSGLNAVVGSSAPGSQPQVDSEEAKALEFGKAFVADLENNRLASAYRSTSASFQKQTERKAFDEMIAKNPGIRNLASDPTTREHKVRKSSDGEGYEFYCTARDLGGHSGQPRVAIGFGVGKLLNIALMLTQENGALKVAELEITPEP
jgi:hypothetical protein